MYYSIGTPLGVLDEKGINYFYREDNIFKIERSAFRIWVLFLHGMNIPDAIKRIVEKKIASEDEAKKIIEQLCYLEMIVPENKLMEHKPARQGQGVGYSPVQKNSTIFLNEKIDVSHAAFLLWCFCDGKTDLSTIIEKMTEQFSFSVDNSSIMPLIHELLRSNLITFIE